MVPTADAGVAGADAACVTADPAVATADAPRVTAAAAVATADAPCVTAAAAVASAVRAPAATGTDLLGLGTASRATGLLPARAVPKRTGRRSGRGTSHSAPMVALLTAVALGGAAALPTGPRGRRSIGRWISPGRVMPRTTSAGEGGE
ncbi:hypothetical protein AB0L40_25035 [Patulibacter sp. NPDC049589]|uniref:hypothetical protein n=1 Tax=Patulibacter sp. NPDC049589 TaxID=3154731 RepID=UPI00341EAB4D